MLIPTGKRRKMNRSKGIIRTSIIGIVVNILLAIVKAVIGIISNSIAIISDAINNLSDSMSSLITMIGTKLSTKEPNRKHPFGYGRIEYITTLVIGTLIVYAGYNAFAESLKKIFYPEDPDYSVPTIIIISAAIVVKAILGLYTKASGQNLRSDALVASGKDALNDVLVSIGTLAAAIIYNTTGYKIEAYVGILIAILIMKAGFETLRDTISEILGQRISPELTSEIRTSINSFPEVAGVYDLIVHNYGKEKQIGSVHIEVHESLTASYLDGLERQIVEKVYADTNVALTGISVYSMNHNDEDALRTKEAIKNIVAGYKQVLNMHGFYKNNVDKNIRFDLVFDFDAHEKQKTLAEITDKVKELHPEYDVIITMDHDISD